MKAVQFVDRVGAETWRDSLRALATGGRAVTCGATTGGCPETDRRRIFRNQLSVIGSTMGTPVEVDDVPELVRDGAFEPHVRETLPTIETARGHEPAGGPRGVRKGRRGARQ